MRFRDSNEPSNTVLPIGTYCPACHEDAVAAVNHKNSKNRQNFLSRLLSYCCIPRRKQQQHHHTPSPSPVEELTCLACGYLFTPSRETYSRRGSDILESDKRGFQNEYSVGHNLPPLRPPSSTWMRRTGFTPQPELLELMDHEWCSECGLFVKQINGSCSKCGTVLKKNHL